jgi:hypothetical protein
MRHLILFTRFGRRDKLQLYGLWSLLPLITCVLACVLCQASCNFGFNIKDLKKNKTQNSKKDQWLEPSKRRQKGEAKERPKDTQATGTKKKGES